MSTVLITSWAGGGNAAPAANLGARLAAAGHRVRLLGWHAQAADAAQAGVEFASYPSVPPWPAGLQFEDAWTDRVMPALDGDGTRTDVLHQVDLFKPDVMVVDCMMRSAWQAAREWGGCTVVLLHLLPSRFGSGTGPDAAQRRRWLDDADSVLALVPPGFDEPLPQPRNLACVGPIMRMRPQALDRVDAALLASPGRPWVLLSLSTTQQGQQDALPGILAAVGRMPVRVLLTLGGAVPVSAVHPPPNVTVRGFVPHDQVLPHVAAVISHAGLTTVTAALAAGVPLLCIPQGRDQFDNAERVSATGVGRALPKEATPVEIRAALTALLADDAARVAARRFAAVIGGLGRGEAAARIVAGLPPRGPAGRVDSGRIAALGAR